MMIIISLILSARLITTTKFHTNTNMLSKLKKSTLKHLLGINCNFSKDLCTFNILFKVKI